MCGDPQQTRTASSSSSQCKERSTQSTLSSLQSSRLKKNSSSLATRTIGPSGCPDVWNPAHDLYRYLQTGHPEWSDGPGRRVGWSWSWWNPANDPPSWLDTPEPRQDDLDGPGRDWRSSGGSPLSIASESRIVRSTGDSDEVSHRRLGGRVGIPWKAVETGSNHPQVTTPF